MHEKTQAPDNVAYNNPFASMGFAAITFFLFGIMGALTKIMTESHHIVEIIFYRNALTLPFIFLFLLWKGKELFKIQLPVRLAARCIFGILSMAITFAALKNLPITDFTAILFLSTLLTPLGAHFILKERVGKHRMFAIFIGLAGALIIAQPSGQNVTMLGISLAIFAAISHSALYLILRTLKTMPSITVTFYFIVTGTVLPAFLMPWFASPLSLSDLAFFFAIGLSGGFAQYCLTTANRLGSPSLVAPFNYTGLIWASGFDILIWHHFPALNVYLGAIVIIVAKAYIIYREHKKKTHDLNTSL